MSYACSPLQSRPRLDIHLKPRTTIRIPRRSQGSEYESQLAARFGERNRASFASSLPESWKLALARSLMQTQWFTRNVVINRWFLHADTAPLRA